MTPKYSGETKFVLVLMIPSPACPGKTTEVPSPMPRIKARAASAVPSTPGNVAHYRSAFAERDQVFSAVIPSNIWIDGEDSHMFLVEASIGCAQVGKATNNQARA